MLIFVAARTSQTKMAKHKASILAASLIILGMTLAVALMISLLALRERSGTLGLGNSTSAFQNANTGVEVVMKALENNSLTGSITGCQSTDPDDPDKGKIVGTTYKVELKDIDGQTLACSNSVYSSSVKSIKSVGSGTGEQRAIEAAVAMVGCPSSGTWNFDIWFWRVG